MFFWVVYLFTLAFTEINPESLPEIVTKADESGVPVLIRTMQNGKYQITAGTIDALVESLADNTQPGFFSRIYFSLLHFSDLSFFPVFLFSFKTLSTSTFSCKRTATS